MERIERLERANKRWRVVSLSALAALVVMLGVAGYAFSQRDAPKPAQDPPPGAAGEFAMDRTSPPVTYTNFVRVSVTPEELVLDLGLNSQMTPDPKQPIQMFNRVVMNFYTAKRLSHAINDVVRRYEATYGPLELDVNKRALLPGK